MAVDSGTYVAFQIYVCVKIYQTGAATIGVHSACTRWRTITVDSPMEQGT